MVDKSNSLNRGKGVYMNLRTDYAFKKFFGSKEYAHLLIRFLNSIFEGRMTVTDVTFENKEIMDKNSEAYRSGEYEDFFEAAELGSMAQEEIEAYSQSYARLQDMENAVAYSFAKGEQAGFSKGEQAGFSKGEQLGKFSTIRQLFKGGFKIDDIARSLGMSSQEVHDIVSNPI